MVSPPDEIAETFGQFISAQNNRDESKLRSLLRSGSDFLWLTTSAVAVWGSEAAIARFRKNWESQWHLAPEFGEMRVVEITTGTALLHVPLLLTFAPLGEAATPVPIKWSGVFAHEASGWKISAILLATVP
jgi:hypothetical protein